MFLRIQTYFYCLLFMNFFYVSPSHAEEPIINDALHITQEYIRHMAPQAYSLWESCQKTGERGYEGFPLDSCSVLGHPGALRFRKFLQPWLKGNILDIGCGPQPIPSYLEGYPIEKIAGIDPMEPTAGKHPFAFCRGLAEFLPWRDDTFDTIVIGTSLDHVILLDKVLNEIHRTLKPSGNLVLWVSFAPYPTGPYNAYSTSPVPFDKFHLFHFSKSWFFPLMQEKFNFVAQQDVSETEAFYVVKPKTLNKTPFPIAMGHTDED